MVFVEFFFFFFNKVTILYVLVFFAPRLQLARPVGACRYLYTDVGILTEICESFQLA